MPVSVSPRHFEVLRQFLKQHSGMALTDDKTYLVEARLSPLMDAEGISGFEELVSRLDDAALARRVMEAMTIGETLFFRDNLPFRVLEKVVLPRLIEARAAERRLTIFCGACSSGQEPYSVAMLLRERFPDLVSAGWRVRILAADLASNALVKAAAGRYSQLEVNRGLPAALLVKYFTRVGLEWQIADQIRSMVDFRELNLIKPWPPLPTLDVAFLRNVLIYFDVDTKKAILRQLRHYLQADAILFLGSAEAACMIDPSFEAIPLEGTVCYRQTTG